MSAQYESAVNMVRDDKFAYWYSNYPPEVRKMEKLMKEYPDDIQISNDYRNETGELYGLTIKVPMKWYRTPSAPRKMNFSEEHRKALAERAKSQKGVPRKKKDME